MRKVKLKHGNEIPLLGIGTWQLTGDNCIESIEYALEVGYRHIDTADMYGNHNEVGKGIKNSNVKRSELFVTSKVWRDNLKKDQLIDSLKRNLDELSLDYLDLYLVHWPDSNIPIMDTLEAMEKAKEKGLINSYGVSNFTIKHIERIHEEGFEISNNQVEFHPTLYQKDLYDFCMDHGIYLTAYSPIARGKDLDIKEIKDIAEEIGASTAQAILSWLLDKDIITIPKAGSKEHIEENFKSQDIHLSKEQTEIMDSLNQDMRLINPPFEEFDY